MIDVAPDAAARARLMPGLLVPVEAMQRWLDGHGWRWEQLEREEMPPTFEGISREELQLYLICADPVLWCERNLADRVNGGLWRLFPYQAESMRYLGSTCHQCGAEVGKTRELVGLSLWRIFNSRGDQLITASQDGQLDTIWDEQLYCIRENPFLAARVDWNSTRVKPYKKLVSTEGNILHLRPAGFDGEALRGLHVLHAYMDEATKVKNHRTWDEFFGRILPGGTARIYSTPDGERTCRFYDICAAAQPYTGELSSSARPVAPGAGADAPGPRTRPTFVRFRWPKSLMPPPFWTEERRRKYLEEYGGVDSAGYQQLVEGEWGTPAASVFPYPVFVRCVSYVPEYVVAKLVYDASRDEVSASAWRLNRHYQIAAHGRELQPGDAQEQAAGPLEWFLEETFSSGNLDLDALLRQIFTPLEGLRLVGGGDFGASEDPTELLLAHAGERLRIVARLQMRRFGYHEQKTAVAALDSILRPVYGWGCDAGNAGRGVLDVMQAEADDHHWSERISQYVFQSAVDLVDPVTMEARRDPLSGKVLRDTLKELGTQLLEHAIQRQQLVAPYDPDLMNDFPSHTATKGSGGQRIFGKVNDHTIDAARCLALRFHELESGLGTPREATFAAPGTRRQAGEVFGGVDPLFGADGGHAHDVFGGSDGGRPW